MPSASTLFRSPSSRRVDRIGVALSAACLLHCLAGAALVSAFGFGSLAMADPWVHRFGLVLAIGVAALSLGFGMRHHRLAGPRLIAVTGISTMAAALFVEHGPGEAGLTVAGVVLVALAHLVNLRHSA